MIKSIKLKEDYVCFFKKQKFEFKNVTLLVGDQGCGKSTVLSLIFSLVKENENKETAEFVLDNNHKGIIWVDTERDNPNTSQANPKSSSHMLYTINSKFQSHGENMLPILAHLRKYENHIVLVDEPETALSLRSQFFFVDLVKELISKGNQVIISTHSLTFMEAFKDGLLSLEHNKYMSLENFVKSQKKPSDFKDKRNDKIIKKTKCKMGINCKCANETGWYNRNCEHYVKN